MKLLIVEDESSQIEMYIDGIDSFNKKNEIEIQPIVVRSVDDAKQELLKSNYDCAIIDLKLVSGSDDLDGLELVVSIKDKLRFPIFIVSGSISQIDQIDESAFLKKRLRDDDFQKVLKEAVKIYSTGITKILGKEGVVDKYLSDIFWKHISSSIDLWIDDSTRDETQKEKSLLRYAILHMQEYIDEEIEKYHPNEFYIVKPIKKNIFTGDIIKHGEDRYVVLTPSCDIVLREGGTRNAEKILFCKIKSLDSDVVKNFSSLNKDTLKSNDNRKRLNGFIENKNQRYHFIPRGSLITEGLIDFQDKITISTGDVESHISNNRMKRIATISTPFLKDIISRYSNYYARQGSPDFDSDEVYNLIFEGK